jgi:hypothetical protein
MKVKRKHTAVLTTLLTFMFIISVLVTGLR